MSSQNTVHAALELRRETDDMLLFHPPKARGDASKLGLSQVKSQSVASIQHHCSNIVAEAICRLVFSTWSVFMNAVYAACILMHITQP